MRELSLEKAIKVYENPFSLSGITGGTNIVAHLADVSISFEGQEVIGHIPVISDCGFDMLLGQDVLLGCLKRCAIHFETLWLSYWVLHGSIFVEIGMQMYLQPNEVTQEQNFE